MRDFVLIFFLIVVSGFLLATMCGEYAVECVGNEPRHCYVVETDDIE